MCSAARAASNAATSAPGASPRRVPVARELREELGDAAVEPLRMVGERVGHARVQRDAIAGQQIVLDRLAHERVAEAVLQPVGVGDEDVLRDRFAHAGEQIVGRHARRGFEQSVIGRTPDDRRAPQRVLRRLGEPVDAGEHDLAQRRRHRRAVFVFDREELLGEERVAVGADVTCGRRARSTARAPTIAEISSRTSSRSKRARSMRSTAPERSSSASSVRSGWRRWRSSERYVPTSTIDACAQAAGEVHEQLARRPIGPVQILEHEQRRDAFAQALEHPEQLLEQHAGDDAFARRRVQLGQQRRELVAARTDDRVEGGVVEGAVQRAQHLHDRAERQRAVDEVEALADEHERRLAGDRFETRAQLGDEPRLADAGLAAR